MIAALELAEENALLKQKVASQRQQIKVLEEMLRYANQKQYGRSSEQSPQQPLFDEAESLEADEASDAGESSESIEVPAHSRKKQRRVSIPEGIQREEIVYDLEESEKVCPHDGTALKPIGEETHEQLGIIPAQIKALKHIRKLAVPVATPCSHRQNPPAH